MRPKKEQNQFHALISCQNYNYDPIDLLDPSKFVEFFHEHTGRRDIVFNKLDALDPARVPHVLCDSMELQGQSVPRIFVSARTGVGLPELRRLLAERVSVVSAPQDPGTPGALPEPENEWP